MTKTLRQSDEMNSSQLFPGYKRTAPCFSFEKTLGGGESQQGQKKSNYGAEVIVPSNLDFRHTTLLKIEGFYLL